MMPPPRLKATVIIPLVNSATTKDRIMTIRRTSLRGRKTIPIKMMIFANPSFTPGTGIGIGINDSSKDIIIALETNIIMTAYLLFLFIRNTRFRKM